MAKKRKRAHYMADFGDDFGDDFGAFAGASEEIAGPLVGGGAAQVGILAAKLLFKSKPGVVKWAGLIGTVIGGGISAALMSSPRHRRAGIQGLMTAIIVGVPRQIEDLMTKPSATAGYMGLITPEQEMAGYFGDDQIEGYNGMGANDVQLLGGGQGTMGSLGVITPEQEMSGPGDVELLGAGGFGSNFLS